MRTIASESYPRSATRPATPPRRRARFTFPAVATATLALSASLFGFVPSRSTAAPQTAHPRLLVRADQLTQLRARAVSSNPTWMTLKSLAETSRDQMNAGTVPKEDLGTYSYETYPTEMYAELFAFMALVDPDAKARDDWGKRARTLLMYVIDKATPGVGTDETPFRAPIFSTGDRSRWQGESFGLTLDWAYQYFSAKDKAKVRTVYERWAKEQYSGYPMSQLEAGTTPDLKHSSNDPALVANRYSVRWSINNYWMAHARNLGLMSMAFDPADDPNGTMRKNIPTLSGQWLFTLDRMLRTDAAGGLSPEGFEYGSDAVGRTAQLMYAMQTAGEANAPVAKFESNRFWADTMTALLSSLPYSTFAMPEDSGLGRVFQPAWFGDGENYWALDPISLVAPIGLAAADRGDRATLNTARWIAENVGPGGKDQVQYRAGGSAFFGGILYFLLLDPNVKSTDPRQAVPKTWFASGINRLLARTCWCADERFFAYMLSWSEIDHQRGDGNDFAFLRKGEWLTKNRVGYSNPFTDFHNTMAIQNDPFIGDADDYRVIGTASGSQWGIVPSGDPKLIASERASGYTYAMGDATNLYNSKSEGPVDIKHASRSIVWLEPDVIVLYDRAVTGKANRFKRVWFQLPAAAKVTGNRATVETPKGQRLHVTSLLPSNATLRPKTHVPEVGAPAVGEPMNYALSIDATGNPISARFLTVLEGADKGANATSVTALSSSAGTPFAGAVVKDTAVLFPVTIDAAFTGLTVSLPATVRHILVTGLTPGGSYTVTRDGGSLRIATGGSTKATKAGVLDIV